MHLGSWYFAIYGIQVKASDLHFGAIQKDKTQAISQSGGFRLKCNNSIGCTEDKTACHQSMHSVLKHETSQLHQKLDSLPNLRALLQPTLSMAEYCRILIAYAQAHYHVEQHLTQTEKTITLDALPCYAPRLPSLCNDLRSLAMPIDLQLSETLMTSQLTRHQGMFHYIGLRYVLEGASQGSKFIATRLEKNLPLLASQAFSFWNMQRKVSR